VSDVELSSAAFRGIQLIQNLVRYAFLVEVARLVAGCLLPEQAGRGKVFRSFTSSDQQLGTLFEAFVRNFLVREQRQFSVARPKVPWAVAGAASSDPRWLPDMSPARAERSSSRPSVTPRRCKNGMKALQS
jgi:5-methylcytosine-specific restriction enzyme subunit McrC